MDIGILLALQDFRNGTGSHLAEFMSKMTFLGELNTVMVIMAAVYWCVSRNLGAYLLLGWSGNRLVNGVLKLTFCVYRPWIRDVRVVPYGNSINTATGYSFPSGHSMNAASVYGGAAVRGDMPRGLRAVLGAVVVLVAFSRNFLGVHTPQDVLVGAAAGMLVIWLVSRLMRWVEARPQRDIPVACVGIALFVLLALYAAFKSYPVDYDADGKVLVEGAKMAADAYKGVGWGTAFLVGWVLERRFVTFSTDVPLITKMTRLSAGLLGYYAVSLILVPLIKGWIPGAVGIMTSCFIQMAWISFIFPWLFQRVETRAARKAAALS